MSGVFPRAGRRAVPVTSTLSTNSINTTVNNLGLTDITAFKPATVVSDLNGSPDWMIDDKGDTIGDIFPKAVLPTSVSSLALADSLGGIGEMGVEQTYPIYSGTSKVPASHNGRRAQSAAIVPSFLLTPPSPFLVNQPITVHQTNDATQITQNVTKYDIDDLWSDDAGLKSQKHDVKGNTYQLSRTGVFGEPSQSPSSFIPPAGHPHHYAPTGEGSVSDTVSDIRDLPPFMMDDDKAPVVLQHQLSSVYSQRGPSSVFTPKQPLTLDEQETELLSLLYETERDITNQELEIMSLNGDLRRDEQNHKVESTAKEREKEKELAAVDKKCREDLRYADLRKKAIEARNEEGLSDLECVHKKAVEDRTRRICEELQEEINKVKKDIDILEDQKRLLLKNGVFEEEDVSSGKGAQSQTYEGKRNRIIYARLMDSDTLEDKLQAATMLLIDHHREIDNRILQRVGNIIHLESASASSASHERRRKGFFSDSEIRHNAVSNFKSEMMSRHSAFHGTRHHRRNDEVLEIQETQKRHILEMRESSQKAVTEANEAAKVEFKILVEKFKGELEGSLLHLKQRHCTITEDDSKIAAAQSRELASRLELTRSLQQKIESEQRLSLKELGEREEVRGKQINEMSVNKFSKELHGTNTRSESGSTHTWYDVKEAAKHLAELRTTIDTVIAKQTERNTAFRAIGKLILPEVSNDNNDVYGGPKLSTVNSITTNGLHPEEVTILSLLKEKKAVLDSILSTVRQEQDNLHGSRCRLQTIVDEFVMKMSTLMGQVHDGRLQQQSELSRADVTRTQWAKEHRAMLFHKHCDGSDRFDNDNPLASFNASMNILLGLAKQVRSASVKYEQCHEVFVQKMKALHVHQREHDSVMADEQSAVELKWEQLFEKLLCMNDTIKKLSEKQTAVLSEEAKLSFESELLNNEKRTLAQKAISLEQDRHHVYHDIHATQQEHAERLEVINKLEGEQRNANREVLSLIRQQADLRDSEADHYRELRRIDKLKDKLRPACITKSTGRVQDGGVVEAFKKGVHHYPAHKGAFHDRPFGGVTSVTIDKDGPQSSHLSSHGDREITTPQPFRTNLQESSAIPNNDDSFIPVFYYPTTTSSETDRENRNRHLKYVTSPNPDRYPMPSFNDMTNTFEGMNPAISRSHSPEHCEKMTQMTADDKKKYENWSMMAGVSLDAEDAASTSSTRTSAYEEDRRATLEKSRASEATFTTLHSFSQGELN